MAIINSNHGPYCSVEAAAAYVLLYDPVLKKWVAGSQRCAGLISSIIGSQTSVPVEDSGPVYATTTMPSMGKTSVHL